MSSKTTSSLHRNFYVDQPGQASESQVDQYDTSFSGEPYHTTATQSAFSPAGTNRAILLTPSPQVRRVKPQNMLRSNSRSMVTADSDEGYQTGMSDQNSVRTPRTPRKQAERDGVGRNGTIMEETRFNQPSGNMSAMTDFFSSEVFHIVLHNPTTAHRFLRFCQSRACGENIEFLQRISTYNRLLDEMATALGAIHTDYIAPGSTSSIGLPSSIAKKTSNDLKEATYVSLPGLESIFAGAQQYVEQLLASDIYPRFVKHQITASATMAMASNREKFNGLGDCFCLTDPHIADNPIVYASDGFVSVTGYSRKDIIPRNCRFLQGRQTDPNSVKRLRISIDTCEETVELLLNYRKNGDPFWNLLYVSPLLNEHGEVAYFLGGQIDCSTTIHSCTDVLKVLSANDDELDLQTREGRGPPSIRREEVAMRNEKTKSSFFKSWRKYKAPSVLQTRDAAGMEGELLDRVGKMSFKTQIEAFYTAYSKYVVLHYNAVEQTLLIQHFSPGIIDMLHLTLPNGAIAPINNKDIFTVLGEHSASGVASSTNKALKRTIHTALKSGTAVSVEIGLMTGFAEKKPGFFGGGGSNSGGGGSRDGASAFRKVEERYVTHWTPLKGEEGYVRKVVLTIVPKM